MLELNIEDKNTFIKRKKKSVSKNFSATRSKTIESANELTVYLMVSKENYPQAYDLINSYANKIELNENHIQRWIATCDALALLAYIEETKGNISLANMLSAKIVNNEIKYLGNKTIKKWFTFSVDAIQGDIDIANSKEVTHNEKCQILAQAIIILVYFRQVAPFYDDFTDTDKSIIETDLQVIQSQLFEAISP